MNGKRARGSPHTVTVSMQVTIEQFPEYVCKIVGELYDTVEAVVKKREKGPGALSTLVLCDQPNT